MTTLDSAVVLYFHARQICQRKGIIHGNEVCCDGLLGKRRLDQCPLRTLGSLCRLGLFGLQCLLQLLGLGLLGILGLLVFSQCGLHLLNGFVAQLLGTGFECRLRR